MYHDPCHTPMKTHEPLKVGERADRRATVGREERALLRRVAARSRITRPDIATQVRFRKEEEMRKATRRRCAPRRRARGPVKILTSCPSLPAGPVALHRRLTNGLLEADYIVVEMARHILGENWMPDYVARGQRRRHRARAGLGCKRLGGAGCAASRRQAQLLPRPFPNAGSRPQKGRGCRWVGDGSGVRVERSSTSSTVATFTARSAWRWPRSRFSGLRPARGPHPVRARSQRARKSVAEAARAAGITAVRYVTTLI